MEAGPVPSTIIFRGFLTVFIIIYHHHHHDDLAWLLGCLVLSQYGSLTANSRSLRPSASDLPVAGPQHHDSVANQQTASPSHGSRKRITPRVTVLADNLFASRTMITSRLITLAERDFVLRLRISSQSGLGATVCRHGAI